MPALPRSLVLTALALSLQLVACGSDAGRSSVKVGVLLPYTGDKAAVGGNLERAIIMAVESVNQAGGVQGKDLMPVFGDTKSDPEHARVVVGDLLAQGVQALIGPEGFDVAEAILPQLRQRGILFISPYLSDSIDYRSEDGWPWFRLAPTATAMGEAMAKRLSLDGHGSVGFISTKDRYCKEFAAAAMRRYQELGGTVAWTTDVDPARVSYAAEVQSLPTEGTSVVTLVALPLAAARLVTDISVALPQVRWQWYLAPHLKTPAFLDNTVTSEVEGAIGVAPQSATDSTQFSAAYQRRFLREKPLEGVLFYYDATALLALSLERALLASGGAPPGLTLLSDSLRLTAVPSGIVTRWNELGKGLNQLAQGRQVYYAGLTGPVLLDADGARQLGTASYWEIERGQIRAIP